MTQQHPDPIPEDVLNKLFPAPRLSLVAPFPGATAQATKSLIALLKENHNKWHIFFNDSGFHNHLAHHLLAVYALGATPDVLQAAYDAHASYQAPRKPCPNPITPDNWKQHLGKLDHYSGYLAFFTESIIKDGIPKTIERYIFAPENNKKGVSMFSRFQAGLLHPLIHIGYGTEFNVPGTVAEGLAMAACSSADGEALFPPGFFEAATTGVKKDKHALDILGQILKDEHFAYGKGADPKAASRFRDAANRSGERLTQNYFNQWDVDPSQQFDEKLEELAWVVTTIFGLGGWSKDKPFKANFFMVHLVNASLFIPSLAARLSPANKRLLLRGFLATILTYYVGHGRPSLHVADFFASTNPTPVPPHAIPPNLHPSEGTLDPRNLNQNPWMPIITSSLNHPDEHLIKCQRALAHYASVYGTRPSSGKEEFKDLEGGEKIDGSLFIRVAGLVGGARAWMREGEEKIPDWNRDYFEGSKM